MRFIISLILLTPFSFLSSQYFNVIQENFISVIENNDTLKNPWTGGFNAVQISLIDLNNDQIEDVFIFDRTGNKVLTFLNDGINYNYAPEYEKLFPNNLKNWVILRDFNGDNKKDIFGSVSGGIGVWKNTSSNNNISFSQITNPFVYSYQFNTTTNLYVASSDIPDINDVDGDGDLDVLSFGVLGNRLEYHKNKSVELGYGKDSLIYELKNSCWGHFTEDGLTNTCQLYDTCLNNVNNPQVPINNNRNQIKHQGSTVLSLDLNNDQVKDLLLGDVSFSNIVALYNDSKGVNMNTSFVSQDTLFPSNSVPADLYVFPATFYEDLNNDGIKDLIVSPNSDNETNDNESIWYYQNAGTNSYPQFYLQSKSIFQDQSIELGRGAKPILVDINNDQLTDLIVANFGQFDLSVPIHYRSFIKSYINTGTNNFPVYTKSSDDFQNLSTLISEINLTPAFGDLDADGDLDAIIGDFSGNLHYLENNPNLNNSMNLSVATSPLIDQFNNIFDVGYCAHPVLIDIDNDGDLDLVVGEAVGNLNYIENIGDSLNFNFDLNSETFGGVDVSEWWTNIGSSTPFFIKENNELQLYVGSERGAIFKYNNISNNLNGNFNLVDSNYLNVNIGPNSVVVVNDLNNDSLIDFIIGNKRGGLSLFKGTVDSTVNTNTTVYTPKQFILYPNPVKDILNIDIDELTEFTIYNLTGQKVKSIFATNQIPVKNLDKGIYFLSFTHRNAQSVIKFIK